MIVGVCGGGCLWEGLDKKKSGATWSKRRGLVMDEF